ncbi:hypothetical protein B0H13DRAFT_2381759 [Mycena leptocephala]|nr:hypothetical protein B0H13DRAFT_2381759 [Mycena leptocephala]
MFNAFVVSASLTPSAVSPAVATIFAILAWRAISVSGRVPIFGGENIIAHFVDTEIINHRFLYPNWDRPAQMFDADFSPDTPPHKLIHYHGPPLQHRCPACQEPVSALPERSCHLLSAIDGDAARETDGQDISFVRFCLDLIDERVFQRE